MKQRTCLINLARGIDVFAIIPANFRKGRNQFGDQFVGCDDGPLEQQKQDSHV